jgi:predicted deacylase
MEIGTAVSTPGTTATGWLDVTELPTGTTERLPVILAEGTAAGPTLWVTGGIHGNEVTGVAAAQDFLTDAVVDRLRGTVVCLPILNPSGVRLDQRNSYYHDQDPNRNFPYDVGERSDPPSVQELINQRLFDRLSATADALISLHEGWINETVYTIVERVRYGRDRSREAAAALAAETTRLADAFGLPVVREHDAAVQESHGLHRSFESAAVNAAGIPAITPELGSPHVVEEDHRAAAIDGIHDVMRALDMLPGEPRPGDGFPDSPVDYPVKRADGPVTDRAGIVRHRVEATAVVAPGDPIADVVTPHGDHRTTVTATEEGYVLGRRHGIAAYENDGLVSMAARDRGDLLAERT